MDERTEERRALAGQMREYQASCELALAFLVANRPCSRCGSTDPSDGRGFFTPKTYHSANFLGAIVRLYSRAAADRHIEKHGLLVVCAACWTKLRSNGTWQAILDARKEKSHV